MTGGIAGSMNGGRISACTFTGTGVLEAAFNTVPEGYYVYAQAGGIVGSTAEASIESCTADFGGSLLVPKGGEATCNAGIVCGNSGSSITRLYREIYVATPQSRATAPSASAALSDRSPASVNAPSRSFRPKWVER